MAAPVIAGIVLIIIGHFITLIFFPKDRIGPLNITASVDKPNPPQYSTIHLIVKVMDKNNSPVSFARIEATAHYQTKDTKKIGSTDDYGEATLSFRISRATIGYEVIIDIRAKKGKSVGSTKASFIPRARME